ncbi:MAG: hypothetical protein HW411_453, partial [Gammaproteobacteria bacterium]|nr:hypothetical protein [Gammaproteobacteria bacterium]
MSGTIIEELESRREQRPRERRDAYMDVGVRVMQEQ